MSMKPHLFPSRILPFPRGDSSPRRETNNIPSNTPCLLPPSRDPHDLRPLAAQVVTHLPS